MIEREGAWKIGGCLEGMWKSFSVWTFAWEKPVDPDRRIGGAALRAKSANRRGGVECDQGILTAVYESQVPEG